MNRMSATTFLSLYFSSEYGTGLRSEYNWSGNYYSSGILCYVLHNFHVFVIVLGTISGTTGHPPAVTICINFIVSTFSPVFL